MATVQLTTTQNVSLTLPLASVGERILAYLLDILIIIAYMLVANYCLFGLLKGVVENVDNWSLAGLVSLFNLPALFYTLFMELFFKGQTFGKKALSIRVISEDGLPLNFIHCVSRWIFLFIDFGIGSGMAAVICMLISSKSKRLGDLAAGTLVVKLPAQSAYLSQKIHETNDEYIPLFPLVVRLSDRDVQIIQVSFEEAINKSDATLLRLLEEKVCAITGIVNTLPSRRTFIETVLNDYRHLTEKQ